ncbi:hypothetical protein LWF01_06950 [Saxibacter everestensis]|uniref:Protein kinase domain-containing protein n=1 Tax=Saxibacter everestensis TaxID=2909229 RepID=A0ABY8QX31_9MICO|nr:hypothetical protein LWF01_06950 [Brevibacteriaceae bacterium ZFBP1038]
MHGSEEAAGTPDSPSIPGYEVLRPLGAEPDCWLLGAGGTSYAARIVLDLPEQLASFDIDHRHLLRVHDVVSAAGRTAVISEYAAAGAVWPLALARGGLPPGEVVTVAAPTALALSALHNAGFVHGAVSGMTINLRASGQPAIEYPLGPGNAGSAAEGQAADVRHLARTALELAAGRSYSSMDLIPLSLIVPEVPAELLELISSVATGEVRISAAEFGAALLDACPAEPVRIVATDRNQHPSDALTAEIRLDPVDVGQEAIAGRDVAGARPPSTRRALQIAGSRQDSQVRRPTLVSARKRGPKARKPGPKARKPGPKARERGRKARRQRFGSKRTVTAAIGVLILLSGALFAARGIRQHDQPSGEDAPLGLPERVAASLAAEDPSAGLTALAWVREQLFATADERWHDFLTAPSSSARAADQESLQELERAGQTYEGLRFRLSDIKVLPAGEAQRSSSGPTGVRLAAESSVSKYRIVGADGHETGRGAAQPPRVLVFTLARHDGRWVVQDIEPAPAD